MFTTTNKKIAVEPFPTTDTQTQVVAGRVVIKQRTELTALRLVFPSESTPAGRVVYVRGDLCKHPFAKEIFELDGKQFILLDDSLVVGYERYEG